MVRNLKYLILTALALIALGAVGASTAKSAEFHCSLAECRLTPKPDGTGKSAHHVFIVENEAKTESVSFTCEQIKGHLRTGKSSSDLTLTAVTYPNCTVNGSSGASIEMEGCDFLFTLPPGLHIECPLNKRVRIIVFTIFDCHFDIPAQLLLNGLSYTTVGSSPNREITISTNVSGITVEASAGCSPLIKPSQKLIGTYTTGNTLLTGETLTGEVMADAWFA